MKLALILVVTISSFSCIGQSIETSKSKEIINPVGIDNSTKRTLSNNDSISTTNNTERLELILEKKEKIGKIKNKKIYN